MTRTRIFLTTLAITVLASATPAQAAPTSHFNRMFPSLRGLTSPTTQQLADLAGTMLDTDKKVNNNPRLLAGFTYGGQFLDHDLTLDSSPPPTSPTDPVGLPNGRTFKLDLDSVYGGGPGKSPRLYASDQAHFLIGHSFGQLDLPRNPDGSAIIAEPRNDENEIISQLHVAFLLAHNRLIDMGYSFTDARQIMIHAWQHVVLDEYLPGVLGRQAVDDALNRPASQSVYQPGGGTPMTPLEFSVAAFRFGHSEVRHRYNVNDKPGGAVRKVSVFALHGPSLAGGRPLRRHRVLLWGYFFKPLRVESDDAKKRNFSRRIDTLVSRPLFQLPIPGAEATGSNVLAYRNMTRAKFYGLPSYESVARHLGVKPVGHRVFRSGTPLWYGILRESHIVTNGETVGPTGARIIADTIIGVLRADSNSILNGDEGPTPPSQLVGPDGQASFEDIIHFARLSKFMPGASH